MNPKSAARRISWRVVVVLGALTAMGPVGIDMYLPTLPAIGKDLGADEAQMQATVATYLGGMAIGQMFYGPASDRLGRRPPVLFGLLLFVLGSIGCALATSGTMIIWARLLQALGACSGAVVARASVRDRFDHGQTANVLSMMMLIMGLAPVLAPLIGGTLMVLGGWRINFWVMAGFGVVLVMVVLLGMKKSLSPEAAAHARSERPFRAYLALLRRRRLVGFALAGGLNGSVLFTYISASPGLLIGTYGIAPEHFGWFFGFNAVGMISIAQVNRLFLRRMTPEAVVARMSFVTLGVIGLLALAAVTGFGGPYTVLPCLFLVLSSYGMVQGNTMASALNVDPRRAGSISAVVGSASFAVGALASALAGVFHDGTARPMALTMLGAGALSTLCLRTLALPPEAEMAD